MATNDNNRVTKDISARKQPQGMTAAEVKATQAYYNTLVNELKDDHIEQINNLRCAHSEDIASLKAEWEKQKATHVEEVANLKAGYEKQKALQVGEIASLKTQLAKASTITRQKEKEIVEAAEAKARNESRDVIAQLNQNVEEAKSEVSKTREHYISALATEEVKNYFHKDEADRAKEELRNKEAAKDHEIALLKRKVAIEVKFRCKGGRTRTYLMHPHARFKDAVEEFCKDVGKEVEHLRFYSGPAAMENIPKAEWNSNHGVRELLPAMKTLQGLGIKDGAEIWFTR